MLNSKLQKNRNKICKRKLQLAVCLPEAAAICLGFKQNGCTSVCVPIINRIAENVVKSLS